MKKHATSEVIDQIYAKCVEVGDCWQWTGSFSQNGTPVQGSRERTSSVRKVLYDSINEHKSGRRVVWTECANQWCVCPDHLRCGTRKMFNAVLARRGKFAVDDTKRATRLVHRRSRPDVKLSMESARQIRSLSPEMSAAAIARKFGVADTTVLDVLRGKLWKEPASLSASVFNWRPAA